ncbi:MAG: hypothetical protein ACRDRR_21140 [Pseudonocardiaceae bacterium]
MSTGVEESLVVAVPAAEVFAAVADVRRMVLGQIFTGKSATMRPEVNREGMRETLRRLKSELESAQETP